MDLLSAVLMARGETFLSSECLRADECYNWDRKHTQISLAIASSTEQYLEES